ncbi:MAG: exodeoxyribonuclease VII small subunit [Oscillospiraceae bacterium]|jgi:exodeoxyribonuclease VII small subunit|nr:exodeoxyribonuclease VII small subunit [Oscillospiraceae bacterium]
MKKNMTFEAAAARLKEIVDQMESGDLPLEKSLKLFEEGSALASYCYQKLSGAEQKIRQITDLEETDEKSSGQD